MCMGGSGLLVDRRRRAVVGCCGSAAHRRPRRPGRCDKPAVHEILRRRARPGRDLVVLRLLSLHRPRRRTGRPAVAMGKLAARDNVVNQLSESLRAGSQNLVTTFARIGVVCCGATRWWRKRSWKNSDLVRCPMDREVGSRVKNARRGCCAAGQGCARVLRPDALGWGGRATNGSDSVGTEAAPRAKPSRRSARERFGLWEGFSPDPPKPKAARSELPSLRAATRFVVGGPSGPTLFAQHAMTAQ